MTKRDRIKQEILTILTFASVVTTRQIADYFFSDRGSPIKRASEVLRELEDEKKLVSNRREIDESKVWRLSNQARNELNAKCPGIQIKNNRKIGHFLAITDVFLQLYKKGGPIDFRVELREPFWMNGEEKKYSPDIYFEWKDGHSYLVEVQRTRMTGRKWAEKWKMANLYFKQGIESASWQTDPTCVIRPTILALSNQLEETVKEGADVPVVVVKTNSELVEYITQKIPFEVSTESS